MKYINDVLAATVICSAVLALSPSEDKGTGRGIRLIASLVVLSVMLFPLTKLSDTVDRLKSKLNDFVSESESVSADRTSAVNLKLTALSELLTKDLLRILKMSDGELTVTLTADVSDPGNIIVTEVKVVLYASADEKEIIKYLNSIGFDNCIVIKGD